MPTPSNALPAVRAEAVKEKAPFVPLLDEPLLLPPLVELSLPTCFRFEGTPDVKNVEPHPFEMACCSSCCVELLR